MSFSLLWFQYLSVLVFAKNVRFEVRDAVQRDLVVFTSDAPLEKVIGQTNAVVGWIALDIDNLTDPVTGEFEVDLRTFDTGMELRNDHFRDRFMNTSEFPFATFTIIRLINPPAKGKLGEQAVKLKAEGELKLKGLSKLLTVSMRLTYFKESPLSQQKLGGNLLRISSQMNVDVLSFGIPWNDTLKARLSRNVDVAIDLVGTDRPPLAAELPPDGVKPKETKSIKLEPPPEPKIVPKVEPGLETKGDSMPSS